MLETSARLLKLLSLLQTPRDWTGAELAERLQISGRTVRSDIERLRALGYPVHATRGKVGGYRLAAGTAMPPLLLEDEEAVAVAIALRTAAAGIAGIEETSLRALSKLEQVLPARLRHRVNALLSATVRAGRVGTGPRVDVEVLNHISAATRDRERLRFDYQGHGGAESRREVEPYRLVNWGRRWYLVAYDMARKDWRTFRADRIRPLTPNGARFTPRELPDDAAELVMRGVSTASWQHRAAVTVHAPAEEVVQRINPSIGTVEAISPDGCILHTGASSVETLGIYLSLLGLPFTVTDPPELVAYLKTLAARYTAATP